MSTCYGCAARQGGAKLWQVGFVVGMHFGQVQAYATSDEQMQQALKLCTRHRKMAARASVKEARAEVRLKAVG